jgi:ssDNA thymidine ADP-ribosyltransferase, DarT
MALTAVFVDAHIAHWQQQLSSPYYPHRKHWPTRLYHHAPLENALAILREGVLRSRNDTSNSHPRDVAAPGVIEATTSAHDFVRLYFRPKTPTQYHIEGIRKSSDFTTYAENAHAPVLIMFGLESRMVLSHPNVQFSDKNMQLTSAQTGDTEAFFAGIPFDKVFHEGNIGGDRSLIDARCAEVLSKSPLVLEDCLREIYFRSEPERDTLLYALGDAAKAIRKKIRVRTRSVIDAKGSDFRV